MNTLKNQIALVTGASGGIGGAIATALAHHGASVCLSGRDQTKLEGKAGSLRAVSPRLEVCRCDLTKDEDITALQAYVTKEFERLDILVHCAGAIDHGKLADAPLSSLD